MFTIITGFAIVFIVGFLTLSSYLIGTYGLKALDKIEAWLKVDKSDTH